METFCIVMDEISSCRCKYIYYNYLFGYPFILLERESEGGHSETT